MTTDNPAPVGDSFKRIAPFLHAHEGGDNLAVASADAGGRTIYGISERAYPRAEYADFWQSPTWEKAEDIYRRDYYNRLEIWRHPLHYQAILLDLAVNHGPHTGARIYQRGIGVDDDGVIGWRTITAAWERQERIGQLIAERIKFYAGLVRRRPRDSQFSDGWTYRAVCLGLFALGLKSGEPVDPFGRACRGR